MWFFGKKNKKNADQLVAEALVLIESRDFEQARSILQEATALDPGHAHAWYCLGTVCGDLGDLPAAVDGYQKSAKYAPADKRALPLYNMGNAFQALGRLEEALVAFEHATDAAPDMADAWINRGRLLDDAGEHEAAIDCYNVALRLTPDDIVALSNRGNSLRSLNQFEEAKASYEAALALDSGDLAAIAGIGNCLSELGQPAEGIRMIDQALAINRFPPALADRAVMLSRLERHAEALDSINEAVNRGLTAPAVWNNRGEILAKLGRVQDALASFELALNKDPEYVPALFGKARVLCNNRQFEAARATIDEYFKYSDGSDGLGKSAHAVVMLCDDAQQRGRERINPRGSG